MTVNWNNALWLARRHMRDIWSAYLYTALYFAFLGLVLANDTAWGVEFALPILMSIIIQPTISNRYMTYQQDNEVARHQMFLHSLPISFGTIVSARAIAMVVAGLINVPIFFLPFWYLGPNWNSLGTFFAWSLFWIGMGLVGAGLALVQEFWLSVRGWVKMNAISVVIVIGVLILLVWQAGFRPYAQSVAAAESQPLLLAISGLSIGLAAMVVGLRLAVQGFRRREFGT